MTARIALQLYSMRAEADAQGLSAVLEQVSAMGYAGVEAAALHELSPAAFAARLDALGLTLVAAHCGLPTPEASTALLDEKQAMGATDLVVAYLPPEDFSDAAHVSLGAERLNRFNDAVRQRGMNLGYHNHFWEFASRIDGAPAYDRFLAELDPSVFVELDTYWTRVGGTDPVAVIDVLGKRARLLHIKDGPGDDHRAAMTALGQGAMNIGAICSASRAGWHIVELDRCATDMTEAVAASQRYLVDNGFAAGTEPRGG